MNYYWWRSNGPSGASGYIHARSIQDAELKLLAQHKEPDVHVVLLRENVKKKEYRR